MLYTIYIHTYIRVNYNDLTGLPHDILMTFNGFSKGILWDKSWYSLHTLW